MRHLRICLLLIALVALAYCEETVGKPFLIGNLFKQVVHSIPIPDIERETKNAFGTISFKLKNITLEEFDLLLRPTDFEYGRPYPIHLTLRTKASMNWRYDIDTIFTTGDEGHLNIEEILIDFDFVSRLHYERYPKIIIEPSKVVAHNIDLKIKSKGMSNTAQTMLNNVIGVLSSAFRTQIENTLLTQVQGVSKKLSDGVSLVALILLSLLIIVPITTIYLRVNK
jgi:hypothetical protein